MAPLCYRRPPEPCRCVGIADDNLLGNSLDLPTGRMGKEVLAPIDHRLDLLRVEPALHAVDHLPLVPK